MAYEKHTGTDNEVITAAKLNNMENGITDSFDIEPTPSVLIINESESYDDETGNTTYTLDKTWQEIYNAFLLGPVFIKQLSYIHEEEESIFVPDDPSDPEGSEHEEQATVVNTIYSYIAVRYVNKDMEDLDELGAYIVFPHLISVFIDDFRPNDYWYTTDSANGYPSYVESGTSIS